MNFENSIIVKLAGGIGNLMFQIGAGYSYAKKYNKKVYLYFDEQFGINVERRGTYGDFFNKFEVIDILPNDGINLYEVPIKDFTILPDISSIKTPIIMKGYFQNEVYIDKDVVEELFRPDEKILQTIKEKYGDLSDYVSINTRRGDFVGLGLALNSEYYMGAYNTYFAGKKAIIIGEDVEWNKQNIIIDSAVYTENNAPLIDLYINYVCGHSILNNGSFCWWGAFLSETTNKKIIMPKSFGYDNNWSVNNNRWIKF